MDEINRLNYLLTVLDYSPLATAVLDTADLNIAFANRNMLKVCCETERIFGMRFDDAFPGFRDEGFSDILKRVWNTGVTFKTTNAPAYIYDDKTKHKRYFDFEYRALLTAQGKTFAILMSVIDVSDKNKNIDGMKELQEQLDFNSDLENITHTIAHEAKNPISIVKLGLDALSNCVTLPLGKVSQWYAIMREALVSLEHILDDMVALSEARNYKMVKDIVDIASKIHDWSQEGLQENKAENVSLEFGELLPVYSDVRGVSKVFIHVICNAIKYAEKEQSPHVKIYSTNEKNGVAYYIVDNGIGIPENRIDTIFEHNPSEEGLLEKPSNGLGMFLAKRIMNRLGAEINISSKEHAWTAVRLFFPD